MNSCHSETRRYLSQKPFQGGPERATTDIKSSHASYILVGSISSCTKPPNLNEFTSYREDGKTGLQFYTDPDYFYALWVKEEQEKINERKKNRAVSLCIPRFMQLYPDIVLSASCMSRLLVRDYISSFSFRLLIYTPMLFIARLYVVT